MATVHVSGAQCFRQRIVSSILSGRPVKIDRIRADDEEPGLRDYEAGFLRLVDKLTNGTHIEVDETGTILRFNPGFVAGGKLRHDCGTSRAMGYFIEGILPLVPFAKVATQIAFSGITNGTEDPTVDDLRNVALPLMWHFGVQEGLSLQIKARGAPPAGGGSVLFHCPTVQELKSCLVTDTGFVKRIRGVAYATRVTPQTTNRIVDASRGVLNAFAPDVYIFTDHYSGKESGRSPGFGATLVAETTAGHLLSATATAAQGTLPEDLGEDVANMLCEEIDKGGCVDRAHQALMIQLMALTPEDVSKIRVGPLTQHAIRTLRTMREFLGIMFKLQPQHEDGSVLISCLGTGFKNTARRYQ